MTAKYSSHVLVMQLNLKYYKDDSCLTTGNQSPCMVEDVSCISKTITCDAVWLEWLDDELGEHGMDSKSPFMVELEGVSCISILVMHESVLPKRADGIGELVIMMFVAESFALAA